LTLKVCTCIYVIPLRDVNPKKKEREREEKEERSRNNQVIIKFFAVLPVRSLNDEASSTHVSLMFDPLANLTDKRISLVYYMIRVRLERSSKRRQDKQGRTLQEKTKSEICFDDLPKLTSARSIGELTGAAT